MSFLKLLYGMNIQVLSAMFVKIIKPKAHSNLNVPQ